FQRGVAGHPGFIPPRRWPVQSCERRVTDAGPKHLPPSARAPFHMCVGVCGHALSTEADLLSTLDAERPLAEAHRESLRKQLWRGACGPEHPPRADPKSII